jgi:hypothetical protein
VHDVCQQNAGSSLNLTLTGNGHTHMISLSSVQVDSILAGATVTVDSTLNGSHLHSVRFN